MAIEVSPPSNWLSSLTLCGKLLSSACELKNLLDIYIAQALTQILPIFINGPLDHSIEDSYVDNYLSSLLTSVLGSNNLLNMKWINSQLHNDNSKTYKPDFLVYSLSSSMKRVVLS